MFASDLGADLESQLLFCSAEELPEALSVQPSSESQVQAKSEMPIVRPGTTDELVEVANSVVTLVNGDIITLEVPASSFDYLQFNGQYLLTYSYAQNYFSDTADQALDANAFRFLAQSQLSNERFSDSRSAGAGSVRAEFIEAGSEPAGSLSSQLALSTSENQGQVSGAVVLANLTATTDFDATIRVFADSQADMLVDSGQSDFGARQLPSEIRIEPNLTSATVLPDPGPTITRTIVVNRQTEGLVLQEQPVKQFGPVKPETTALPISVSSNGQNFTPSSAPATSQTSVTKTTRPTVTIKTLDISQVRRNDVARPWLRSTTIQTPARQHDFGFAKKTTIVNSSSTSPLATQPASVSKSEKSAKWSSRVSATRLQPVEFLLAPRDLETEKSVVLEEKSAIATDVAMSSYSDANRIDPLENEALMDWLNASGLGIQTTSKNSEESIGQSTSASHASETWLFAMATEMQRVAQYPPANANRDSWKSLVRSASESAAGQAVLATLSTITVQQKEENAFGSRSAWEFVTRPKFSV